MLQLHARVGVSGLPSAGRRSSMSGLSCSASKILFVHSPCHLFFPVCFVLGLPLAARIRARRRAARILAGRGTEEVKESNAEWHRLVNHICAKALGHINVMSLSHSDVNNDHDMLI